MITPERKAAGQAMFDELAIEFQAAMGALDSRTVGEAVIRLMRARKGLDALVSFLSFMPADEVVPAESEGNDQNDSGTDDQ